MSAVREAAVHGRVQAGSRAARSVLALAAAVLLGSVVAVPANASDEGGGTESIFHFGPTARGIGLGSAMAVLGDDASASFWNPALLHHAPITQLTFSHNRLGVGAGAATFQYAGIVVPTLGSGGFGASLMRVGLGDIPTYDASSRPTGSIEYAESQLLLGYGTGVRLPYVGGRVDVGVGAKVHHLELGESATSGGLDAGLLFCPPQAPRLSIAVAVSDLIAPSFRLVEREDKLPRTSRLAAAYLFPGGAGRALRVAASLERPQFADAHLGLAGEVQLPGGHSARLGLTDGRVGVGLGARWRAYGLDYAYLSGSELGASHYFSVTWLVGESIAQRREQLAQQRQREVERATALAVATWLQDSGRRSLQEADSLLAAGDLAAAERATQQAEGFGAVEDQLAPRRERVALARAHAAAEQLGSAERAAKVAQAAEDVRAALDAQEPEQARIELERLVALDAGHPLARRYREEVDAHLTAAAAERTAQAQEAQSNGDFVAALQAWSQVLRLTPQDPTAQQQVARIRDDVQNARTRASDATQQLALQRRYTEALQAFADGRPQQALELCRAILRDVPDHQPTRALSERAQAQLAGRPNLTPQQEEAVRRLYLAGLEKFTAGEYAAAVVEWEKILAIDPDNQGALGNIREARSRLLHLDEPHGGRR